MSPGEAAPSPTQFGPLPQGLDSATVLVVDDEATQILLLEHLLRENGRVRIVGTTDSREAARLFDAHAPDLVLLDLEMPYMDGYAVLEQLRARTPEGDFLPILVISGQVRAEAKRRALACGATDFVGKPYDPVETVLRVRNQLQARTLHRRLLQENERINQAVRERTRELQDALHTAGAASRAKSAFLSVVSHELRTPLTAIIALAELLRSQSESPLTPAQEQDLLGILAQAEHLADLISEILEFTNLETGTATMRSEPLDVRTLVWEVLESVDVPAGVQIHTDLPEGEVHLVSDSVHLLRVLTQMLSNAVKFAAEGEVRVSVRESDAGVTFEVQDFGAGIRPEHREQIFEAFWQAEDPMTRRASGLGLGLSVARERARLLGGTLYLAEGNAPGARFVLTLPTAAPPPPAA